MTQFNKETYRANREAGLRGQGPKAHSGKVTKSNSFMSNRADMRKKVRARFYFGKLDFIGKLFTAKGTPNQHPRHSTK